MAVLKLRNGAIAVTMPIAVIVDSPDQVEYNGEMIADKILLGQEIVFGVHPRDVDDHTKWIGDNHGTGMDVVEVLTGEKAEAYFKK